ncbi:hypothetical protein IWW55_004271 [Coemansia sp. RSA 2706]|nr:hypothetical protein IWW55_004271 [Coemansia sp. RSA 2706]
MVIVTLSNSNETHWFSPRIADITEPLFNLLANMRCLLINGFDTREFSFPTYPVLFSYDSVGGDELGRGNIRVDDRTGYIVTHIQQPTNMEEDIVDIYSAHGVGIEYQHQVQLLKFDASTLAKLIRVPLVHGRSVEVVSMDAFISMLENDEVDMITTVVPEASNYVLCMPAIRFVRSNGQLVAFDMFRPVGWPDE